jgi:diaminohydroxyphosphoribosylaminopyrimidine deaminase / 5-amino-6-(5-phosphoribosylamino)uracil reductase
MRIALREAEKGLGRCSPNPAVGAVVVNRGRLVSTGYHRKAGRPHAEIETLGKAAASLSAAPHSMSR